MSGMATLDVPLVMIGQPVAWFAGHAVPASDELGHSRYDVEISDGFKCVATVHGQTPREAATRARLVLRGPALAEALIRISGFDDGQEEPGPASLHLGVYRAARIAREALAGLV
jgi:hypothetical protein